MPFSVEPYVASKIPGGILPECAQQSEFLLD